MAAESYTQMRASTADRDRVVEVLKASFVEGRLTQDEFDLRLGQVFVSRYFAELMALIADLPVGPFQRLPAHPVAPRLRR
jgi:hypothetical protein